MINPIHENLIAQIAIRRIKKKDITDCLSIQNKTLERKLFGESPFTAQEAFKIRDAFFPDMTVDELFAFNEK